MKRLLAGAALMAATLPISVSAGGHGSYTKHTFTNAKGSLSYTLYVPPAGGTRPTNLVVVLPGASETSDGAMTRSNFNKVAEKLRFVVAYPEQSLAYNSSQEWDWATASKEGRSNREASIIAGLTKYVAARQHLNPKHVYVMGISAGAGMASAMAVAFPDVYFGLGIEAGCPFDNVGCGGGSFTADQSAAAAIKLMGSYAHHLPVFNEYGSVDPIAVGVSSSQVIPSWLTIDDTLDNGKDDGSVSRTAAQDQLVTPPLPNKPYRDQLWRDNRGCALGQNWVVYGEQHAWSGGTPTGDTDASADPLAPDASTAMYRFWTSPHTLDGSAHCA